MSLFRNWLWASVTLFFFTTMLFYQPAFATEQIAGSPVTTGDRTKTAFPIKYVTHDKLQEVIQNYERLGYHVKRGSLEQLQQLLVAANNISGEKSKNVSTDIGSSKQAKQVKKQTDCKPAAPATTDKSKHDTHQHSSKSKSQNNKTSTNTQQADCNSNTQIKDNQQTGKKTSSPSDIDAKPMPVTMPNAAPAKEPTPPPSENPHPPESPQAGVNLDLDIFHGGGGNGGDSAKVFFIITGIVVVAAFVVYAGKYMVDIAQGKIHDLWWELTINNTYLDTIIGQNGHFSGLKIATGVISSDLFQVALIGEIGKTDLKLTLNENTIPINLDFSANYWMMGATTRIHLSDTLVNASYLFLEFMGGKTDRSEADTIGAARAGISLGIYKYLRLGASIGAQYIGLSNDQGFINNNDKYWYTYGIEMGVRF